MTLKESLELFPDDSVIKVYDRGCNVLGIFDGHDTIDDEDILTSEVFLIVPSEYRKVGIGVDYHV